jgi:hypothetical protein
MIPLQLYPAERHDGRQSARTKRRGLPAAQNVEVCDEGLGRWGSLLAAR